MGRQIVHHHDVAGLEFGDQKVCHIGAEGIAIHGPVEDHRGGETAEAQAGGEGGGLPVPMRHRGPTALATGRAAVATRHLGRGAGLVDEDQLLGVQIELAVEPGLACVLHVGALLLSGIRRLFLSVIRRRLKKCQTVEGHTFTPRSAARRSAIS